MIKLNLPNRNFVVRSLISTLLFSSIYLSLAGCDNRATGTKLADAGIGGSEKIAQYYENLAEDAVDIMELEAFRDGISGGGIFQEADKSRLEKTIEAMRGRAKMARQLEQTYRSLRELSDYDAGGAVKESASALADAIKGLPGLPGSSVIPSAIIGEVGRDIAAWKQSRDIRRGAELLLLTHVKIKELMDKELDAYKSISEERFNKAGTTIETLISKEMVASLPLIKKVPESLGLKLVDEGKPVKDLITQKGLIEVAKVRFYRQYLASASLGDTTLTVLMDLIEAHRSFEKERGRGIGRALASIARAQVYIDQIQQLRNRPTE